MISKAILFALTLPCSSWGADLVAAGGLEEVLPKYVRVRLEDGKRLYLSLPESRKLSGEAIAAQFHLADWVQVTYKDRQLKDVQFLRPPTADELAGMTVRRPWRSEGNLLKPAVTTAAERRDSIRAQTELERIRQVNLEYVAQLPNFVADEAARRSVIRRGSTEWRDLDTVTSELSVKGTNLTRTHILINGKPRKQPEFPVFNWDTGFATELQPLFDPDCPTVLEFVAHETVNGRAVSTYRFHSPMDGCFDFVTGGRYEYNPPRTGSVLIDDVSGKVMRFKDAIGTVPSDFDVVAVTGEVTWDSVRIGDATQWLPVAFVLAFQTATGLHGRATVLYRNHRHFEASANVTFH